jgi:hypothetical protein
MLKMRWSRKKAEGIARGEPSGLDFETPSCLFEDTVRFYNCIMFESIRLYLSCISSITTSRDISIFQKTNKINLFSKKTR